MPHEFDPTEPDLSATEAALGALVPARSRVDRDRVMYEAGRNSAGSRRGEGRAWAVVAAAMGALALGEAGLLAVRPGPRVVERLVLVREPAGPGAGAAPEALPAADEAPPEPPPAGLDLGLGQTARDRLARQVLRYGLDGLPVPPLAAWGSFEPWPDPSDRFRQEGLRKILDPGDPS